MSAPAYELQSEDLAQASVGLPLSRGLGRSYGDSSLPPADDPRVLNTTAADRILSFDEQTGVLHAEAGLSLWTINQLFLRRGWFVPVTPGTQFVTLGGMVASDVHGKNHHVSGCFGEHVTAMKMRVADDRILTVGPDAHADLFDATVGGMGLTGHILDVAFRMERIPSPWIWQDSERIDDIDQFVAALKEAGPRWPMTVGWIDCVSEGRNLGRGILMRGRWATADEAPAKMPGEPPRVTMPSIFPSWALNPLSVRLFNILYYWKHLPRQKAGLVHPAAFFYPLDMILHWNRMYGRAGFTQYQCVIPDEAPAGSARRFLELLTKLGGASFLCVIKDCGPEGRGILSFPQPGMSVALDIPIRRHTQELVDQLNRFVRDVGGRIYLTKDGYTRAEDFRAMEPRLDRFQHVRQTWDPMLRFRSAQSIRLLGDPSHGS